MVLVRNKHNNMDKETITDIDKLTLYVKSGAAKIKRLYEDAWSLNHSEALGLVETRLLVTKVDKYLELMLQMQRGGKDCDKELSCIMYSHFVRDLRKVQTRHPRVLKPGRHHKEPGKNPEDEQKEQDDKFCSFCSMDELAGDSEEVKAYKHSLSSEAAMVVSGKGRNSLQWVRVVVSSLSDGCNARLIAEAYLKAAEEGDDLSYNLSFSAMGARLGMSKKQIERARAAMEEALRGVSNSAVYFERRRKKREQTRKNEKKGA